MERQLTEIDKLKQLAEKHTVHYEVWPDYSLVEGKAQKVGFELDLCGSHDHGQTRLSPGCELCVHTFDDLRQIADWITPKEVRESEYAVQAFDSSLHAEPRMGLRPEVVLAL